MTGGEPLIQPNRQLEQFVNGLGRDWKIDLFTNGSQALPPWVFTDKVTVVMDWKLPGSGESETDVVMRKANAKMLRSKDAIKFVCKDEHDLEFATHWTSEFYSMGVKAPLWAGIVWGGDLTDELLVSYITWKKLPWRLNVQVHNHIWDPQERGR
jgi:organic radical activating enzyme